jgi:UDP-glucuronate 4-epimerase
MTNDKVTRTVLVTGAAGFIGFHLCQTLLAQGHRVIGFDALTDYYDVTLKHRRRDLLAESPQFTFIAARLETPDVLNGVFNQYRPDLVVHLAAQAGVRHSIDAPASYVESNLIGTFALLEAARAFPPAHMLLASTSSVFGANTKMPYAETDKADLPMSFYAATKKATEAMAHSYAHLYGFPVTMFRFFTVYGPWGRPDMAPSKFARAILTGQPIDIYNHGRLRRDFTYIDDLIYGVTALLDQPPPAAPAPGTVRQGPALAGDSLSPVAPYRVVNIGNAEPVWLMDFIAAFELAIGQEAQKNFMPMQPGDVFETWADTNLLTQLIGPLPHTGLATGVARFVDWYRGYHKL